MQQTHERHSQTAALEQFTRAEGARSDTRFTSGQQCATRETKDSKEGLACAMRRARETFMRRAPWMLNVLASRGIRSHLAQLKEARRNPLIIRASIVVVATLFGLVAAGFIMNAHAKRDTTLTAKFIQALAAVEAGSRGLAGNKTSDVLDAREDSGLPQDVLVDRQKARRIFFESLKSIADQSDPLLINVYAADHVVVWSSNSKLIGQSFPGDEELEGAESSRGGVVTSYHEINESRKEQQFTRQPRGLFVEHYIPLVSSSGKVLAVVEFYTEPPSGLANTRSGYLLIWLACSIGGALICLGLLSFSGKRDGVFSASLQKRIDHEMAALLNEVSTVVAHSLRTPLAAVRSSAELALEVGTQAAGKNMGDIIGQVDRMSQWIKDLHVASTSLKGEIGEVNPVEAVLETLRNFELPLSRANVHVEFSASSTAPVTGHHQLLVQLLDSLVANAIDAMPDGGVLSITIDQNAFRRLSIVLRDTGKGMTTAQQKALFRPRCSIRHGGLGIGLMLVKLIMKRFGGQASLSSSKNKGTIVNLCFRLANSG